MGFFYRKQKTDAVEFCRDFYDRYVFGLDPSGGDFSMSFAEMTRRMVGETDPLFLQTDLSTLAEELRALRLEMVGTAWTHLSKEDAAIAVSEFTKSYLANINRVDLWEAMTAYNQRSHGRPPSESIRTAGRGEPGLRSSIRCEPAYSIVGRYKVAIRRLLLVPRTGLARTLAGNLALRRVCWRLS